MSAQTATTANNGATLAASAAVPPPRPPPPEIPKSPPKWPLRPGVLVHVKVDTKQNLCASRTQSPNTSLLSGTNTINYASPLLNSSSRNTSIAAGAPCTETAAVTNSNETATLPQNRTPVLPTKQQTGENVNGSMADRKNQSAMANGRAAAVIDDANGNKCFLNDDLDMNENSNNNHNNNDVSSVGLIEQSTTNNTTNNNQNINTNNDELVSFTTSNLIERILGRLRWRRERSKPSAPSTANSVGINNGGGVGGASGHNSSGGSEEGLFSRSNKRAVNLLRSTGWFGSGKSTNSSTGLMFDKRHHISGITCSDGGKIISIAFRRPAHTRKHTEKII